MTRPETPEERRKRLARERNRLLRQRRRTSRRCYLAALPDDIADVLSLRGVDLDDPDEFGAWVEDQSGA